MKPSNISIHIEKAIIRVTPDLVPAGLLKAQFIDLAATSQVRSECVERYTPALEGNAVMDHSTGLMWSADVSDDDLSIDDYFKYCQGFRLGGFNDWRHCLVHERFNIIDHNRHDPALHPLFKARGSYEWTGSQTNWTKDKAGSSRSFWCVSMTYGYVGGHHASSRFRARPVRVASPAGQ